MNVFQRNPKIEAAPFEGEAILYNPESKQFVKLNRTTALIWDHIAKGATLDDIATVICNTFDGVLLEQAKHDSGAALDEMVRLGLVSSNVTVNA